MEILPSSCGLENYLPQSQKNSQMTGKYTSLFLVTENPGLYGTRVWGDGWETAQVQSERGEANKIIISG